MLILIPVRKNKMQDYCEGPFEVINRVKEVTYDVRKPNSRGAVQMVHINRLKYYHKREIAVNIFQPSRFK